MYVCHFNIADKRLPEFCVFINTVTGFEQNFKFENRYLVEVNFMLREAVFLLGATNIMYCNVRYARYAVFLQWVLK